jgi:hypothetical protein
VTTEPKGAGQGRRRLLRVVLASLALGLAAATISYLAWSLHVPGPARAATTAELRDRGAERYMGFCGNTFEPRFWPECLGGADDWRQRGADALVAFCVRHEPSRMFTAPDCEGADRPAVALVGSPRPEDLGTGGVAAAVALVVLGLFAMARGAV